MKLTKTLGICGSIFLLVVLAAPVLAQTASGAGPVDAALDRTLRFSAPSDTVPADTSLLGQLTWNASMYNHAGEGSSPAITFNHPNITINRLLGPITGWYYTDPPFIGTDTTVSFPLSWGRDTLPPQSGIRQGWGSTNQFTTYTPGYDSSRTVSPLIIPAGETIDQTVTVRMALQDSRYAFPATGIIGVDMGGGLSGKCVSISGLPTGSQTGCDDNGAHWSVSNPTVGTEYTVTIVLKISNSNTYPVSSKPWMSTQAGINHVPGVVTAASTTITDPNVPSLGYVVFSVDESAEWHPRDPGLTFIVDYPGLWEEAKDTTPPTISGLPAAGTCTLWPPNHKLVQVATVTASAGPSGLAAFVVTATSNEPENGLGDGDTAPDTVITGGTIQLRAERSGTGTGRVYTLTATATDGAGNTTITTTTCTVPHDQRKH
ncbi:MAG: hypothetical protein NT151_08680 [Acidobacteria bacterium]|nr:hypothetical protein [Acidobacteriota bacterium]